MSNLLASLVSSADTLEAYGRVLEATQNNVSNASTPGYAKQSIDLYALPFDPQGGATGGVRAGDARNPPATSMPSRRSATRPPGSATSSSSPTASPSCKPTSISPATREFRRPSTTSCRASPPGAPSPTTPPRARPCCNAPTPSPRPSTRPPTPSPRSPAIPSGRSAKPSTRSINWSARLQGYNQLALQGNKNDAGLSARMHAALEQLSSLADVQAVFQDDGIGQPDPQRPDPAPARPTTSTTFPPRSISPRTHRPPTPWAAGEMRLQGVGWQRDHRHRRPTGSALPTPQPGHALADRRPLPDRRPEPDGQAVRRSRQPVADRRQHHRWAAATARRPHLHLQRRRPHLRRLVPRGRSLGDAGPAGRHPGRPARQFPTAFRSRSPRWPFPRRMPIASMGSASASSTARSRDASAAC